MIHPPEPLVLNPQSPDFAGQLSQVSRRDGIYLLEFEPVSGTGNADPYLGTSHFLYKRLHRLFAQNAAAHASTRVQLRTSVNRILCWPTASRLESWLLLCCIARERFPRQYRTRLKLRAPVFVSLLTADPFPRLTLGNRIPSAALSVGPFRTKDLADAFLQGASSLFQIRRCEDALAPDTDHPGCIYGEMNLCLRPCQAAVSAAEYASESLRAAHFLETDGASLLRPLIAARDQASQGMDFEEAARLHRQIEKIKAVCAFRGDLVRPLDQLNGIAVTRARSAQAVRLWPMVAGYWQSPLTYDFAPSAEPAASESLAVSIPPVTPVLPTPLLSAAKSADKRASNASSSMDTRLRQSLNQQLSQPQSDGSRFDDLALLSRWFYSSWRDGAWLPFDDLSKLNYRKLVREISDLLRDAPKS